MAMNQVSVKPIRKVTAGAIGGAAVTVVLFGIKSMLKTDIPPDVASALTVLLTFAISYMTPAADGDLLPAAEAEVEQAA
jgi:hypothetical protein